jgi:hypothetical protein
MSNVSSCYVYHRTAHVLLNLNVLYPPIPTYIHLNLLNFLTLNQELQI